jgi:hypothetical protein
LRISSRRSIVAVVMRIVVVGLRRMVPALIVVVVGSMLRVVVVITSAMPALIVAVIWRARILGVVGLWCGQSWVRGRRLVVVSARRLIGAVLIVSHVEGLSCVGLCRSVAEHVVDVVVELRAAWTVETWASGLVGGRLVGQLG